nr:MAG TPA: hypothetical protein [Caudoviricetes sp.]
MRSAFCSTKERNLFENELWFIYKRTGNKKSAIFTSENSRDWECKRACYIVKIHFKDFAPV